MIPVFEWGKTVHAVDRAATVTGSQKACCTNNFNRSILYLIDQPVNGEYKYDLHVKQGLIGYNILIQSDVEKN
jgi:hypothetical protein